MRGWLQYHGIEPASGWNLHVGRAPIELMAGASIVTVCEWIRRCIAETGLHPIVVIDTVSRNFGAGDENKTVDMAQVIGNVDRALRAEGATVILVHHTPIGETRSRGSSTLPAAADAILAVTYDEDSGIHELAPQKMKDAALGTPMRFKRRIEDLGDVDNFGRPVTTCVMIETDERPQRPEKEASGKVQREIFNLLSTHAEGMSEAEMAAALPQLDKRNLYRSITNLVKDGKLTHTNEGKVYVNGH
jgi:hypothetical protein